jgi:hypothetical protein
MPKPKTIATVSQIHLGLMVDFVGGATTVALMRFSIDLWPLASVGTGIRQFQIVYNHS